MPLSIPLLSPILLSVHYFICVSLVSPLWRGDHLSGKLVEAVTDYIGSLHYAKMF